MKHTGFNRERDSRGSAQHRSEEWEEDPIGRIYGEDIDGPLEDEEDEEFEDEEDEDDLDDDDDELDEEEEEEEDDDL
jgi:hypothetical protein